ncbi:MAG: hypothetical protein HY078_00315 [Elusimicrobia bacterium]|nr:hypothetical protein [Elusimicrobiota bacterium]
MIGILSVLWIAPLRSTPRGLSKSLLDQIARLRSRVFDWSASFLPWNQQPEKKNVAWDARPGVARHGADEASRNGSRRRAGGVARSETNPETLNLEGSFGAPLASPGPLLGDTSAESRRPDKHGRTISPAADHSRGRGYGDASDSMSQADAIAAAGQSSGDGGLTAGDVDKIKGLPKVKDDFAVQAVPGAGALVFDLGGTGVNAGDHDLRFDHAGNGRPYVAQDIDRDSGVLVFDADHDGNAGRDGRELFGTATDLSGKGKPNGFHGGFEALEALVRKAEGAGVVRAGTLKSRRLGPAELGALAQAYGLGMRVGSLGSPPISLAQAGVREIFLQDERSARGEAAFVRSSGSPGRYVDFFLQKRRDETVQTAHAEPKVRMKLAPVPWTRDVTKNNLKDLDRP